MDVLLAVQSNGLKTLSEMVSSARSVQLSSDTAVAVSQTQQILSDTNYLKQLDALIEECINMKSVHEMFRGFFDSEQAINEDVPIGNANEFDDPNVPTAPGHPSSEHTVSAAGGPSEAGGASGGAAGGASGTASGGVSESGAGGASKAGGASDSGAIRTNRSLCSVDCGKVGEVVPNFVTLFLKANARIFNILPQLHLDVLDYCLLNDEMMNSKLSVIFVNYSSFTFFFFPIFLNAYVVFSICFQ